MRLYVSGLPPGTHEQDIRGRFSTFAPVVRVDFPRSRQLGDSIIPRNFVHVELDSNDDNVLSKCINTVRLRSEIGISCQTLSSQRRSNQRNNADVSIEIKHKRALLLINVHLTM